MQRISTTPLRSEPFRTGVLVLLGAAAVILGALAFEHLGGYAPCPLCLQQRYAYYAGVPLLFLGLVSLSAGQTRIAAPPLGLVALGFLVWLLVGGRRRAGEKYAGLRILR